MIWLKSVCNNAFASLMSEGTGWSRLEQVYCTVKPRVFYKIVNTCGPTTIFITIIKYLFILITERNAGGIKLSWSYFTVWSQSLSARSCLPPHINQCECVITCNHWRHPGILVSHWMWEAVISTSRSFSGFLPRHTVSTAASSRPSPSSYLSHYTVKNSSAVQ